MIVGHTGEVSRQLGGGVLPARATGAQPVEAHARDNSGQPSPEVVDLRGIGAVEAKPGLLDGIVRLGPRPEHPVRDRPQPRPVRFELRGQPIRLGHQHILRRGDVTYLTNASVPM